MSGKRRARPTTAEPAVATSERVPDFVWNGLPVYRCRVCGRYERVGNLEAVERHEAEAHARVPEVRESRILGTDGQPLLVAEEGKGDV